MQIYDFIIYNTSFRIIIYGENVYLKLLFYFCTAKIKFLINKIDYGILNKREINYCRSCRYDRF